MCERHQGYRARDRRASDRGALDPLAERAGVAQKAVVPVNGTPDDRARGGAGCGMPLPSARSVWSAHDEGEIAGLPTVAALIAEGRLTMVEGAFNIVDSVFAGGRGRGFSTADHHRRQLPCHAREGYKRVSSPNALEAGAGGAAALARREDVQAADPIGQKRFYEIFATAAIPTGNTYWPGQRAGAQGGRNHARGRAVHSNIPRRIIKAFGLINLIRFRMGWGSKEKLFAQISRRFGFKLVPVVLSDGHYAIDVDNQRTLEVTEKILKRREGDRSAGAAAPTPAASG